MDPVVEADPALPRPRLVKTIGVLNLMIGGWLFFCGTSCVNAVFPTFTTYEPIAIDARTVQESYDQLRRDKINTLLDRERKAGNEAQRAKIRQERLAVEAEHQSVRDRIDFAAINAHLVWPSRTLWIDVISGAVLNLLLLASGLGLIQRAEWGRRLGMVVAVLKVVRLIIIGTLLSLVVVPHLSKALESFAASNVGRELFQWTIEKEWKRQGRAPTGPPPAPQEIVGFMGVIGYAVLILGALYPIASLILLSRPGARAACAPHDESDAEDSAG
jgi:hypothetical protein